MKVLRVIGGSTFAEERDFGEVVAELAYKMDEKVSVEVAHALTFKKVPCLVVKCASMKSWWWPCDDAAQALAAKIGERAETLKG